MKIIIFLLLLFLYVPIANAIELTISSPNINSTEISLEASLSGATSNYYLQGTLRSVESSKYFGETKNNQGNWIDYISSPEKEYIASSFFITDVKEATWSGTIHVRFKVDDANYKGPGNYELKLRRFTGGSTSSAGESNTIVIALAAAWPSPSPILSPSPTPTPSPTSHPSPSVPVVSPSPSPKPLVSPSPKPSSTTILTSDREGTVAGETKIDLSTFYASPTPVALEKDEVKKLSLNRDRGKKIIIVGSGLLLISLAGFLGYRHYLKNKANDL